MMRTTKLMLLVGFLLASSALPAHAQVVVGQAAPDFTLKDLDDADVRLSDFQGQVVFVTFFATWCIPCQEEAPRLENIIWRGYRDAGLQVLGVDIREPLALAVTFANLFGLSYPILLDEQGGAFDQYATEIPTNVIIDPAGVVRYVEAGYTESAIRETIESLLAATSVGGERAATIPAAFHLHHSYPNPLRFGSGPGATVRVGLPVAASLEVNIYNLLGHRVKVLANGQFGPGAHTFSWDGTDRGGLRVASGVYLIQALSGAHRATGRLVVVNE